MGKRKITVPSGLADINIRKTQNVIIVSGDLTPDEPIIHKKRFYVSIIRKQKPG